MRVLWACHLPDMAWLPMLATLLCYCYLRLALLCLPLGLLLLVLPACLCCLQLCGEWDH